jgi:hypothetical protein
MCRLTETTRNKTKINKLWVTEVFEGIKDVYESTSDVKCKMRKAVIDVVRQHLSELWARMTIDGN